MTADTRENASQVIYRWGKTSRNRKEHENGKRKNLKRVNPDKSPKIDK